MVSNRRLMKSEYGLVDEKIYSVKEEVLENFKDYFGMSFEEMMAMFLEYHIISEEQIKNGSKSPTNSIQCYRVWKQHLAVLSHKAINYLHLLQYISSDNNVCYEDEWFEKILDELKIFHFGQGMTGEAIRSLLIPLRNIMRQYQDLEQKINSLESYQGYPLDRLGISYEETKLEAIDCVVASDMVFDDKTSLYYGNHKKLLKKII